MDRDRIFYANNIQVEWSNLEAAFIFTVSNIPVEGNKEPLEEIEIARIFVPLGMVKGFIENFGPKFLNSPQVQGLDKTSPEK